MSEKRRGLGRGLGALIPSAPPPGKAADRPVDVFFPDRGEGADQEAAASTASGSAGVATATLTEAPPLTALPETDEPAPLSADTAAEGTAKAATVVPTQSAPADGVPSAEGEATGDAAVAGQADSAEPDTSNLVPVPGARFAEVPVDAIRPNPRQPRQVFEEETLAELVHSVREIGVLQPIVVRSSPERDGQPQYELIMGERRWRASQQAGLATVPAIIRDTSDDALLRDALLENLHRADLNPLEEAAAYQQLLDDFGCTHEELAGRIGRSRPQISNTIRLLRLPPAVQRRVAAGVISAGHARALLGLDNAEAMDKLAQRIVSEGLSVRATEEAVAITDSDVSTPVARKKPRAGSHHAELDDLAARLADRLDTRVSVSLGRSKGRLNIEFASVEDLNRILEILVPSERGAFQKADA